MYYLFRALYNIVDLQNSFSCSIRKIKSRKLTRLIFGRNIYQHEIEIIIF
jgi:hypothetical protein